MEIRRAVAGTVIAAVCSLPVAAVGQVTYHEHERAKAEQRASDHHHHTGAKIVVGSAAGGAAVGAMRGGPAGAVIGAGVGAAGGALVNKARVHHDVKKREHRDADYRHEEYRR